MSQSTQKYAKPFRILVLEDNPEEAELILYTLEKAGLAPLGDMAASAKQLSKCLEAGGYDLVLCGFRLHDWHGLATLPWFRKLGSKMPVMYVSATRGEDLAIECTHQGPLIGFSKMSLSASPTRCDVLWRKKSYGKWATTSWSRAMDLGRQKSGRAGGAAAISHAQGDLLEKPFDLPTTPEPFGRCSIAGPQPN